MEREIFGVIAERRPDYELTVIEGREMGEKALLSSGKIIWKSDDDGFFARNTTVPQDIIHGIIMLGDRKVYAHPLGGQKKLVICGAGHVSLPIIRIAKKTGFYVICIDDRPMFTQQAQGAGADEVICDSFHAALDRIEGDVDTFFVVVTRGHRWDQECLKTMAMKPHAYIGMMGSRRRVHIVKEKLLEDGVPKEVLDTVYTPIGLSIGAETPEEIAVSVMAEIIQVKTGKSSNNGYPKEILRAITDPEHYQLEQDSRLVMATIVSRRGSAPRAVGTKMLILPDGRVLGTIGGGCIEAEVCREGRLLLHREDLRTKIYRVDLTDDEAEAEGMVCGGTVDVLLEKL